MNRRYMLLRFADHVDDVEKILGPLEDLGFKPIHFLQLLVLYWSDLITLDKAVELLMGHFVNTVDEDNRDFDLSELEDNLYIILNQIEPLLARDCKGFLRYGKWQLVGLLHNDALVGEYNESTAEELLCGF